MDIAQPDVAHCGGITELHRIASLTETYDVALAPHCPLGLIALAACIQVDLVSPNFVIQEMSWGMHYNKGGDLFTYLSDPGVFSVKNGFIEAPTKPGLGIEVNESLVRETAASYAKQNAWRNISWRGDDGSLREW
jgi:galactonate dehydratase